MACQKVSQDFHEITFKTFVCLVTAITNEVTEKDNCKFMLDATMRVCSLLTKH